MGRTKDGPVARIEKQTEETASNQCCEFKGEAFLEPKYFGDGLAVALPRNDPQIKTLINNALKRVRQSGRFQELVERYFPVRIY